MQNIASRYYTPFYCEENIWHLAGGAVARGWRADVAFISNHERACPLYGQRACKSPDLPVFWDYHVILIVWEPEVMIYDPDCVAGSPLPFAAWWRETFPVLDLYPPEYHPLFRLIEAEAFLPAFHSDRSHMRRADGTWQAPPPAWPPPNHDRPMNLESFTDMSQAGLGYILDTQELIRLYRSHTRGS